MLEYEIAETILTVRTSGVNDLRAPLTYLVSGFFGGKVTCRIGPAGSSFGTVQTCPQAGQR